MAPSTTLLSVHQASKRLGVSSRTLRRSGTHKGITAERTCSGVRLRHQPCPLQSSPPVAPAERPSSYLYTRVSSPKQRRDLERQRQHLQQLYPSHLILTDIASGINWKRPGLKTLLEHSSRSLVTEVGFAFLFSLSTKAYSLKIHTSCTDCGCPPRPTLSLCF